MSKIVNKNSIIKVMFVFSFIIGALVFNSNDTYAARLKQNVNFKYVKNTVDGVKISWSNSYKAVGYDVLRSTNGGKYEYYDTVNAKYYIDEDIQPGHIYRYKIKAYDLYKNKVRLSKNSKASKAIKARPLGVKNLNVKYVSEGNSLKWTTSPYASGYIVYRSENGSSYKTIGRVFSNTGLYIDENIQEGVKYTYKVSSFEAINGNHYTSVKSDVSKYNDYKGIDVSYHNGVIDWKKVKKAGISFAMIRIGYGTSKGGILDSQFDYNIREARKAGIRVGIYLYSYADNTTEAKNEAKFVINNIEKYGKLDYPIAFDFENDYRNKSSLKKQNTAIIKTFCDYIEANGYDSSVYTSAYYLKNAINRSEITKYGIWIARWNNDPNKFVDTDIENVEMWQYSSDGSISGIKGRVDLNIIINK